MSRAALRTRLAVLAASTALWIGAAGGVAACRSGQAGSRGEGAAPANVAAPRADSTEAWSGSMNRAVRVVVATPGDGGPWGGGPWPVVTLLHGHGGDAANWARRLGTGGLERMATRFGVVIVCPDGGADSWYLDSPRDATVRMETFLSRELPAWVETRYAVRPGRSFRAITGLSMGGHGALFVAMRHRGVYSAAASMSGGVDLTQFPERWSKARHLGPWPLDSLAWQAHSVTHLAAHVDTAGMPRLMVDVGPDDLFLVPNRRLHDILARRGIAHDYAERPGGHTWAYWTRALPIHLAFFREGFDAASAR